MTDNVATLKGYTVEITAYSSHDSELPLSRDASILACELRGETHESLACLAANLTVQRNELLAALQRLVTLEGADEDDDGFLAMAEDATVRGMTTADYRAELIEDARAAIAKADGRPE